MRIWVLLIALLAVPVQAQETDQTERDRGFLTALIEDNLSGEDRTLRLEGFSGALSSRAQFDLLTIADASGVWLSIRDGAIRWDRSALLSGRIQIGELSAAEIDLPRLPQSPQSASAPSPETQEFRLPQLPVAVRIDKIDAARVTIGAPVFGAAAQIGLTGALSLEGGAGQARLDAHRLDGQRGDLVLDAAYDNDSRDLLLDLVLDEAVGGIAARLIGLEGEPALKLTLEGADPIDDFTARLALATEGQDRLSGTIKTALEPAPDDPGATGRAVSVQLAGDITPLLPAENREFFGDETTLSAQGWQGEDGRFLLPDLQLRTGQAALSARAEIAAGGAPELLQFQMNIAPEGTAPEAAPTRLPFGGLSLGAGYLRFDYARARGDGWVLDGDLSALSRPDLSLNRLTLSGAGQIRDDGDALEAVTGALSLAASGLALEDAALQQAIGPRLEGDLALDWVQGGALRLHDMDLRGDGYGLTGDLGFDDPGKGLVLAADLAARYADLGQLSGLAGRALSGRSDLTVAGDYTLLTGAFDGQVTLAGTDITLDQPELDNLLRGPSRIALDAARGAEGVDLRALVIDADQLTARAEGHIGTGDSDVTARASLRDLQDLNARFGGQMDLEAHLREETGADGVQRHLSLTGTAQDLKLGQAQLDAALRGRAALEIALREAGGLVQIEQASLSNPLLSAQAEGQVGRDQADARVQITLADLSPLGRGWGGGADLIATLMQAPGGARQFQIEGRGTDLALGQRNLDAALSGQTRLSVAGSETGGQVVLDHARLDNPRLSASASGQIGAEASDLSARIDAQDLGAFGLGLGGALNAQATLSGALERLSFAAQGQARDLRVGQDQVDAVLAGATRFDLSGTRREGRVRLDRLTLSNPQISAQVDGVVSGAARQVNIQTRLADLGVITPDFPGPATLGGQLRETGSGYDLNLSATGPGQSRATITGALAANFRSGDLRIRGQADAALAAPFVGDRAVAGPVNLDLSLTGPLGLGALSGRISAPALRVSDPGLGMSLPAVALNADLAGGEMRLNGRAEVAAGGQITVAGPVSLIGAQQAALEIGLNGVVLRDPELYETKLQGTVRLDGPLSGGARLTGRVDLLETEIRVPSTGLGGSELLTGITHQGDRPPVGRTRRFAGLSGADASPLTQTGSGSGAIAMDLLIAAENRLFVRGRGLDAELGGQLRLTGTSANLRPIGAFELIRGRLEILTKRFDLTEGRLSMDGSTTPLLHFVAASEGADVTAFVSIDGPASNPEISFSSTPELAEEEVIAQLLFGRGMESISAFQAAQLASAVATLAGRGGVGVVGRLRQGMGLDDLDVSTDDSGATSLKAGKYLSDNLYTDVEVDSEGNSQINLNLQITPALTARGSTGTDGNSSLGIYYEKDY